MGAAVTSYVNKAVASLIAWQTTYRISGFDLDFENGLQGEIANTSVLPGRMSSIECKSCYLCLSVGATGSTEATWLSAYCQIVKQLKQVSDSILFVVY